MQFSKPIELNTTKSKFRRGTDSLKDTWNSLSVPLTFTEDDPEI